jgi:hypothetical protein
MRLSDLRLTAPSSRPPSNTVSGLAYIDYSSFRKTQSVAGYRRYLRLVAPGFFAKVGRRAKIPSLVRLKMVWRNAQGTSL